MAKAVQQFTVVLTQDEVNFLKLSLRCQIENMVYNCVREKFKLEDREYPDPRIHVGHIYETMSEDDEQRIEIEVEVDI